MHQNSAIQKKIYQEQTLDLPQERWFNATGTIKSLITLTDWKSHMVTLTVAEKASGNILHPFIIHDKNFYQTKNTDNSLKPTEGIYLRQMSMLMMWHHSLTFSAQYCTRVLAITIRQRNVLRKKENCHYLNMEWLATQQTWKNPETLEKIRKFSKVNGYKINTKKSTTFLYTKKKI